MRAGSWAARRRWGPRPGGGGPRALAGDAWDCVAVRIEQGVDDRGDLVEWEFGGAVGVEHCGVADELAPAGECRLDGQALHVDVGLHGGDEVAWQGADRLGDDSAVVRRAWDFDAAVGGQAVDPPPSGVRVGTLPLKRNGLAALAGVDDVRAVFIAGLDRLLVAGVQSFAQAVPVGDLAAAAVDVLVERDVEAVDEVGQVGLRAPPHRVSLESEMAPETNSPDVSGRVRRRQLAASLDAGSVDFGETVQGARLPRLSRAQDSQV